MTDAAATRDPAPSGPSYLDGLNGPQREAVETLDGPLLVLAGAGTGKTRVLTTRIAHVLVSRRAFPGQILAVTFTNRAAREMRERIAGLIGSSAEGLWIGTFHAVAARMLRRHAELAGLTRDFTILDRDDQLRLVAQVLEAEGIDQKRWPPRLVLSGLQRFKDRGLGPGQVRPADVGDLLHGRADAVYRLYQERLRTLNAADFGDLLLHCVTLFSSRPDVLGEYRDRFRYILVDEYQDSNVAQYLWLRLLAQGRGNICCVGDDDQSIYSWRGAEIGNILRFEKDFAGARVVRLEQNYRSTGPILAAASELIARNGGRLGKTLWTDASGGEPVEVRAVHDGADEAAAVGDRIEELRRDGIPWSDVAILVRAGFQMREFEDRLLELGVPHRIVGGPRFYDRREIRDAVAYMRVIAQPGDGLAFERIMNVPARGLGDATRRALHAVARAGSVPLSEAARRLVETDELRPRERSALRRLLDDFERWRARLEDAGHVALMEAVLDESGYAGMLQASREPDARERLDHLKELVAAAARHDSLRAYLEHVSLVMEHDDGGGPDAVSLMTLHAAKGLEFGHVFLPGWEEDLFPNRRALEERGDAALEEERRLAYVGLTRARRRAWILHASVRRVYNQWLACAPSRFVRELPCAHVRRVSAHVAAPVAGGFEDLPESVLRGRGPGFRRMRRIADAGAPAAPASGAVAEGARIFHQKFGYGTVRANDAGKMVVDFEKAGTKKVMESFVTPA